MKSNSESLPTRLEKDFSDHRTDTPQIYDESWKIGPTKLCIMSYIMITVNNIIVSVYYELFKVSQ